MSHLRIVTDAPGGPLEMADAIDEMARTCRAAAPITAMLVWETKEGTQHKLHWLSAPQSWPLQKGIAAELYDRLYPREGEE